MESYENVWWRLFKDFVKINESDSAASLLVRKLHAGTLYVKLLKLCRTLKISVVASSISG